MQMQMQVIMDASIGVVLALCVGVLLFLARKNPRRIKKLFYLFVRTEIKLACMESTFSLRCEACMSFLFCKDHHHFVGAGFLY